MLKRAMIAGLALGLAVQLSADAAQDLRFGTAEVRDAALDEVLAGKAPDAGPALLELYAEAGGTLKIKVVRGLGALKVKAAVKPLSELLKDASADFRLAAAKSLGRIGDPAAAPALEAALKDADEEVREAAARALGACGAPGSSAALAAAVGDKNRLVRLAVIESLGKLGQESALPALESQLADTDPGYQRQVIKAIGSLKSDKALPFLKKGLSSKDAYLRGFSAEALALRKPAAGIEPELLKLLNDEVYAVRVRAVEALGAWKSKAAVAPLLKALRAAEPTLRWKAAQALGAIGDPAAREALSYVAQNDAEAEIKAEAARALKALR